MLSHRLHLRSGFTLVELLIALAAGSVIVLTAMAGFRSALQAVSVSDRYFVENRMLRIGMEIALEEADFWKAVDEPDRPDHQPMRGRVGTGNAGLAFTAFRKGPMLTDAQPGHITEDSVGWNPNPMAWASWDMRSWFHGNQLEATNDTILPWGNYTIHTFCQPGSTQSRHHWYEGQVKGLVDNLGFYGLCEYLPSNAFFSYHGAGPLEAINRTVSLGGASLAMELQGVWLYPIDGADHGAKGRLRGSMGGRYILPAISDPQQAKLCRTVATIGYDGQHAQFNPVLVQRFFAQTANVPAVMDVIPYEWPEVGIQVLRFVERGRMITACIINCYDAKNGNRFVLPFTCAATSLRGARQQRQPHMGWVEDPYHEPTLDYDKVP